MNLALAALWGLAEATVFFVVPDVLLTWVALHAPRAAFRACLAAVAGALVGGWLMFVWGARDPAAARAFLDRVPAISPAMIERVETEIAERGPEATILGPLRGTPYKIYAVLAGERDARERAVAPSSAPGLGRFLALSVPARLPRFLLLTLAAAWTSARLPHWRLGRKRALLAALWGAFYAAYFALMSG